MHPRHAAENRRAQIDSRRGAAVWRPASPDKPSQAGGRGPTGKVPPSFSTSDLSVLRLLGEKRKVSP